MTQLMFGQAKIKAVGDLMRGDDRVVVLGGAAFGGLHHSKYCKPLFDEFDDRIMRTPIAELGFCGRGVGAAIAGLYPIVTIGTGSFAFEAWPQICNEAPNITYMSGGQVKVPVMFQALVGIRISGAAWSDGTALQSVDLRIDDGPWQKVTLAAKPRSARYTWTLWHYDWTNPTPGEHAIVSRASDVDGRVQPPSEDPRIKLKKTFWEANQQWPRKIRL